MPRVCQSRQNFMTWADHERIYITNLPLDSKGISKSLHERLTSDVPYYHNCLWAYSTSSWSNEFSSPMCKCKTSRILLYIYIYILFFFQQSQVCVGSIPESQIKSKISHSLIDMGFIELVSWSRVRGLWKKGLERLKECLRVTLSKNLESVACTFGVGLYFFCLIH